MSTTVPLFSVIIPTYNRAKKVVRAVQSVLAQTWRDYDLWVIDDGSSDATGEALAAYAGRLHYRRINNAGAAAARNTGIQASSGKYVAFLDSDDRWHPGKLAAYAAAIQAHPEAGLFYSSIDVVDEAGSWLRVNQAPDVRGSASLPLLMGNFLATSSVVVRRSCLEETGLFDPDLSRCQDWDLWLRIARQHPITRVPGVHTVFEYGPAGKLTTNTQAWLEAHDRVIARAFERDPGLDARTRQTVLAHIALVKGRICLEAGDDQKALGWFSQAVKLRPALWKAHLFRLLSAAPGLRRGLPAPIRRRLHLPPE